jgi:alpha-glucuronidase
MNHPAITLCFAAFSITLLLTPELRAETGAKAWLRYARLDADASRTYEKFPAAAVVLGDSALLHSAQEELLRGISGMLGTSLRIESRLPQDAAIVLGTFASMRKTLPCLHPPVDLREDAFWITNTSDHGVLRLVVTAKNDRGVLYGVFSLLSKITQHQPISNLDEVQPPYASVRWIDQWDNLDGSIERGYAGHSIFFENGDVRVDLGRAADYARLLASVGINGCAINNVNADPRMLHEDFLPQLARIAQVFRPWGVQLSISVDLASPKTIGGLATFDPANPHVAEWWRNKVDQIYSAIPDFGGFVIKADSEDRPGPSFYGRTQADAANVLARPLQSHGGVVFYRAFVYNHHLDWRDAKNDRAKATYDYFHPLDGKFESNVIIQIKHGPIDFQAREPVSPLFGGLDHTNQAIELQITQEYTGQQRHLCFLIPMWKEVLDFDLRANSQQSPVMDAVSGKTFHRPTGGFVGVANVGLDDNWLGHPLAMANLYGFARLAWNPHLNAREIAEEWTTLTFGNDPQVGQTISSILLTSWHTYESYTGPLGAQTLTDILGSHYGPGIESSEENGWGQWHRADHNGIGMERTVVSGTDFVGQYWPQAAQMYESLATTPDELLLFFHHVPYTYVLHSGKTVIQHIYDSHYEGAQAAADYVRQWQSLRGRVDEQRYTAVLARLEYQAGHAIVWRDAICSWFLRTSGIPDAQGRVGHHSGRLEAEDMQLTGYIPVNVTPWENASAGKAVECAQSKSCTAAFKPNLAAGRYEIVTQYFDLNTGEAKFRLYIRNQSGDRLLDEWTANDHLPSAKIGGDTSTRHRTFAISLAPQDEIRIEGLPDHNDPAALDYIEITAAPSSAAPQLRERSFL